MMTPHKVSIFSLILVLSTLALLTSAASGQSIELRLQDGSRWRGEVGDKVQLTYRERHVEIELLGRIVEAANLYIQLEGNFVGGTRTIFNADIVSIRTVGDAESDADERPGPRSDQPAGQRRDRTEPESDYEGPGVLVLPMSGMVGIGIREQEVRRIGREADRFGPGQIIVFKIDTGGGLLHETYPIIAAMEDIKRRHRLVAWVNPRAISAGCAIISVCHEIYFTRDGSAGAMTAFSGADMRALDGEELERWIRNAGRWMESGGRSPLIAEAMIIAERELSFTRDPETGRVTFYNNLSGERVLVGKGENLTLTAHDAVACGFANGIANTTGELARLLDLPKWHEVSDYGRRIHEEWTSTVDRAEDEVRRLMAELGRGVTLQRQLAITREFIRWLDRAPNVMRYQFGVGSKEALERQERDLRRQIAAERRRGR
jgi:hypothetical protein